MLFRSISWDGTSDGRDPLLGCLWEQRDLWGGFEKTSIELGPLNLLQIDGHGVFPWISIVDIAHTMRCQISVTVLIVGDLVFAFVQAHAILDKKKGFIIVQRWPKRGSQIQVSKKHSQTWGAVVVALPKEDAEVVISPFCATLSAVDDDAYVIVRLWRYVRTLSVKGNSK